MTKSKGIGILMNTGNVSVPMVGRPAFRSRTQIRYTGRSYMRRKRWP